MRSIHTVGQPLVISELLDKCKNEIEAILGWPIFVNYKVQPTTENISRLIAIVCEASEMTWERILGDESTRDVVIPRRVFIYYASTFLNMNDAAVGRLVHRNRPMIGIVCHQVAGFIEVGDPQIMPLVSKIESKLWNHENETNKVAV